MTKNEKIRIGKALEKMKVDVIEAGFAAASPGDFESIQAVAENVKFSTICSLARAVDRDIEHAAEARDLLAWGRQDSCAQVMYPLVSGLEAK